MPGNNDRIYNYQLIKVDPWFGFALGFISLISNVLYYENIVKLFNLECFANSTIVV